MRPHLRVFCHPLTRPSHHESRGCRNWTQVLWKSNKHWAISPALTSSFLATFSQRFLLHSIEDSIKLGYIMRGPHPWKRSRLLSLELLLLGYPDCYRWWCRRLRAVADPHPDVAMITLFWPPDPFLSSRDRGCELSPVCSVPVSAVHTARVQLQTVSMLTSGF